MLWVEPRPGTGFESQSLLRFLPALRMTGVGLGVSELPHCALNGWGWGGQVATQLVILNVAQRSEESLLGTT